MIPVPVDGVEDDEDAEFEMESYVDKAPQLPSLWTDQNLLTNDTFTLTPNPNPDIAEHHGPLVLVCIRMYFSSWSGRD